MASINIHRVEAIRARRHDYMNSPLCLEFSIPDNLLPSDVAVFIGDDELVSALVKAINETVAAHAAKREQIAA